MNAVVVRNSSLRIFTATGRASIRSVPLPHLTHPADSDRVDEDIAVTENEIVLRPHAPAGTRCERCLNPGLDGLDRAKLTPTDLSAIRRTSRLNGGSRRCGAGTSGGTAPRRPPLIRSGPAGVRGRGCRALAPPRRATTATGSCRAPRPAPTSHSSGCSGGSWAHRSSARAWAASTSPIIASAVTAHHATGRNVCSRPAKPSSAGG